MVHFTEFFFPSSTGCSQLRALQCAPEGAVRGIVQFAHGIAEHIDRYRDFMAFLAEAGFLCVGNDHLGHGSSVSPAAEQGVFFPEKGWEHVVEDMVLLHDRIAAQHPQLPYCMFGHSMGSFLLRTYMAEHPDKYDLAIISGTGHQGRLLITVGNLVAQTIVKTKGYSSDGSFLSKLSMGNYQQKIPNPRTACDWLSRDCQQVDRYVEDPLCGFVAKAGLYADMFRGIRYVTDPKNIAKADIHKPVLFLSGAEDPVGEYGAGVKRAYGFFQNAGFEDLTLRLYDGGRHEMLNETNSAAVYQDILQWLQGRI